MRCIISYLGYVQGMSDLLAPLMVVMQNEVESFWCFAGLMNKMESNFKMDQAEIKEQLANLKILLEFIDSKFSAYLVEHDSANMYFCFRWILILFKREFTFQDIMKLWEILWTDMPCKNFHLLICISILLMKKDDIMANRYGFNEILKVDHILTKMNKLF
jgi:TBC1 domain family member 15